MTLTHPPFYIAPLAVAPLLTSPLLPPLLPFLSPGRCFRTWVLTTYQFFYLSLSLQSFAPTSILLPSVFRKLAGMALPPTLTPTVLSAEDYSSLSLSSTAALFSVTECGQIFHSFQPQFNAILKPGGLLRRKVWLVKDARLLLSLTEMMKIARLTSLLHDTPGQSSPKPRRRHGRRLALLFHSNQTRNLYTLFSALLLALLPRLPPLLISPTVFLPGNRLWSMPLT